jgi:hypothetical protein
MDPTLVGNGMISLLPVTISATSLLTLSLMMRWHVRPMVGMLMGTSSLRPLLDTIMQTNV